MMMPVISTTKLLQRKKEVKRETNRLNMSLDNVRKKRKPFPVVPVSEESCTCTIMHVTKIVINYAPKKNRKRGGSNTILSMTSWGSTGQQKRIRLPSVKLAKKFAKKEMLYDTAEFIKKLENQLKALNIGKEKKPKKTEALASQRSKSEKDADGSEPVDNPDDSGEVRRRGKRRRKVRGGSDRLTSAGLAAQAQQDPETQVAGIDTDSRNHSSRGSIALPPEIPLLPLIKPAPHKTDSFLDDEILKYLHREVDEEAIETEFDTKRRYVLQEALRTRPQRARTRELLRAGGLGDLVDVEQGVAGGLGDWLHVPRVFSRRNARFTLPIDTNALADITPMQFAARYVTIQKSKQLLYLTVLRRFRTDGYRMPVVDIPEGLVLMMGGILTADHVREFQHIMQWEEYVEESDPDDIKLTLETDGRPDGDKIELERNTITFRTWCGVCAICERLYGRLPTRETDSPDGMELSDYSMVETKLVTLTVLPGLAKILRTIRNR